MKEFLCVLSAMVICGLLTALERHEGNDPCFLVIKDKPKTEHVTSLLDIRNCLQWLIDSQHGSAEDKAASSKEAKRLITILDNVQRKEDHAIE
jgi:anion-transporting  ArsA/GET3 family ATPase